MPTHPYRVRSAAVLLSMLMIVSLTASAHAQPQRALDVSDSYSVYLPTVGRPLLTLTADVSYLGGIATSKVALEVDAAGGFLYVADGIGGLEIIDMRGSRPALTHFAIPDGATGVQVVGSYAYVGSGSKLLVIDISTPQSPRLVSQLTLSSSVARVRIFGTLAYVANVYDGIAIVDISDPLTPHIIGAYDLPGITTEIQVVGTTAYVAANGLTILDVSTPAAPQLLGSLSIDGIGGIEVVGTVAYMASGLKGFYAIDVSDPAAPTILGYLDTPGSAESVQVIDGVAFIADLDGGFQLIDVRTPATPHALGVFGPNAFPPYRLDYAAHLLVIGDRIYVADRLAGLQIFRYSLQVS